MKGYSMNTIERIEELISCYGMTLYALSKQSGISYNTFDSAKRRNGQLSIDTIERVCDTLKIPLYKFFMPEPDSQKGSRPG